MIIRRVEGHSMPGLNDGMIVIAFSLPYSTGDRVVAQTDDGEVIKLVGEVGDDIVYLAGIDKKHDYGWVQKSQILAKVVWPLNK